MFFGLELCFWGQKLASTNKPRGLKVEEFPHSGMTKYHGRPLMRCHSAKKVLTFAPNYQ
jgi:hypothetical protein